MEYAEFLDVMVRKIVPDNVKEAFASFDHNRDRFITGDELARTFRLISHYPTKDEIDSAIAKADLDYDGRVSFIGMNMW